MKTRNGFISNSSSTSFVITKEDKKINDKILPFELVIGEFGQTEFGWQQEIYKDIYSKINFAYLQAMDISQTNRIISKEWLEMLYEVLKKHGAINITSIITDRWDEEDGTFGYIDHQSSASEGQNTEIFDSEKDLEAFIFGEKSYIHCDNDNH